MNELQALVLGLLAGGLSKEEFLDTVVEIPTDENGDYLPYFYVTGRRTGIRLKVEVSVA